MKSAPWAAVRELDHLVWRITHEYPNLSVSDAICLALLKQPDLWSRVLDESGDSGKWPHDVRVLDGTFNPLPGFFLPWWKGIEIGEQGPWWELYAWATDRWCPDGLDEDLPWSVFLKRTIRARPDLWAQVTSEFPTLFPKFASR